MDTQERLAPQGDGAVDDDWYRQELGARLRRVRRARGLRLLDVEERSQGQLKAVVIGSYERGDRGMTAHRLATLAEFYGVPVAELLPPEPFAGGREKTAVSVAVDRIHARREDPVIAPLWRLVQHVVRLRDEHHARELSLRDEDLQALAVVIGVEPQDLTGWLDRHGLLAD